MSRFGTSGLTVDLPTGWDGQIRPAGATSPEESVAVAASARTAGSAGAPTGTGPSVLHAASFPLPAVRGDYGSGAVEIMGGTDVLVCLLEHEPEAAATALFAHEGVPTLTLDGFSPQSMQRALPGMAGFQRFFQLAGRPFCLYVVVGSYRRRGPLVQAAQRVVRSIQITG